MTENFIIRLFEHNNWANLRILEACSKLTEEQLDAEPQSVTKGSIRETMLHLAGSQAGYLSLLTLPTEDRHHKPLQFTDLQESLLVSGEGLLMIAQGEREPLAAKLQTLNGYQVEPWVVMVQIINHAHEHREQICSMVNALGVTPPDMDGWSYGDAANAFIPISK